MPATSALNLTLRGEEIVGVSGGETPMMPICSPPLLDHDRVGDPAVVAQRLQQRLAAEVGVGRQERDAAALAGDELRQASRAEVVLVVADRDRVVADRGDRVGVVERAGAGVEALEGGAQVQAGEEVVARADRDRALVGVAGRRRRVAASARRRSSTVLKRVMPP